MKEEKEITLDFLEQTEQESLCGSIWLGLGEESIGKAN